MSNIYPAKAYPKLNNEDILEFQVPQSKFQVQLSEVYLHFMDEQGTGTVTCWYQELSLTEEHRRQLGQSSICAFLSAC